MAVTVIQSQVYDSGSGGYTNVHTFTDVNVSGTNTLHIACGFNRNPASDVTSWTSDGNTMTTIKDEINANVCAVSSWYYLINNADVTTVSNTPSYKLQAGITAGLAGIDQTTPITGTPVSSQGWGTSATQSYTGTAGNLLIVFVGLKDDDTLTASSCTEQTSVTGADANIGTGWMGYATATGSSQTIGATWTTGTNWVMEIFEVKAASSSTAYDIVASVGSFALTGQSANLSHGTTLALETGALTLTGQDVSFTSGYVLGCAAGSYALTGNDATFSLGLTMTADPGSFSLTGNDTGLSHGVTLNAETGTFVLTGQDTGLSTQYVVLTETGGFLLTGQEAALTFSQIMSAETGSYTLTGNDTAFPIDYKINPETGTFTLTGINAELNLSSPSGAGNIIIGIAI